ncbi:MAG: (2Fe-2S)-binding protein [Anaerolineae bacterium]|nr:(2Fe-2S)-binding protein [Anaerolineae bacterium]
MLHEISLKVNGDTVTVAVRSHQTLLQVLREELGITSPKRGCENGECGACTVIMNGLPVNSCMVFAPEADGAEIETVEGLAPEGKLHPLQEAFIKHNAVQCGFCTPGMLMSAKALLDRNPHPSEEEIRAALVGNLCRCTGYVRIVEAIADVASTKGGDND